jgi:hypothetical protein
VVAVWSQNAKRTGRHDKAQKHVATKPHAQSQKFDGP